MNITGKQRIDKFKLKHADSRSSLDTWQRLTESAEAQWSSLSDVQKTFNTADPVGSFIVFDICHNKYRLIAVIDFAKQSVHVYDLLTHKDYDRWSNQKK
jgi:mRNA interferase HigB